jgi:hypothetical protein
MMACLRDCMMRCRRAVSCVPRKVETCTCEAEMQRGARTIRIDYASQAHQNEWHPMADCRQFATKPKWKRPVNVAYLSS